MLKKIGWLGKLVAAGLILSFLSIWTTGYIVTSYVETLLKQFNLPLEVPPMAMSGVWGKLWGADPLVTTDTAGKQETPASDGKEPDSQAGTNEESDPPASVDAFGQIEEPPLTDIGIGGGSQAGGGSATEGGEVQEGTTGGGAAPEGGEVQEGTAGGGAATEGGEVQEGTTGGGAATEGGEVQEGTAGAEDTETAMTTDDLTEVKEQMSDADKEELFGLLMTKLPQESWQTISQYVENGLTETELTEIQQIMAQHLDKTEYGQMMDILKKY